MNMHNYNVHHLIKRAIVHQHWKQKIPNNSNGELFDAVKTEIWQKFELTRCAKAYSSSCS